MISVALFSQIKEKASSRDMRLVSFVRIVDNQNREPFVQKGILLAEWVDFGVTESLSTKP